MFMQKETLPIQSVRVLSFMHSFEPRYKITSQLLRLHIQLLDFLALKLVLEMPFHYIAHLTAVLDPEIDP